MNVAAPPTDQGTVADTSSTADAASQDSADGTVGDTNSTADVASHDSADGGVADTSSTADVASQDSADGTVADTSSTADAASQDGADGTCGACDDGNPCTTDACGDDGQCSHTPDDTATCDDGNPCTTDDACVSGACVGHGYGQAPWTNGLCVASIPVTKDTWQLLSCSDWSVTTDGLQVMSSGHRRRGSVASETPYDMRGGQVFVKWMAIGPDDHANYTMRLEGVPSFGGLTTGGAYGGSTQISPNTWYFTHATFGADATAHYVVSSGDWDIAGGTTVHETTKSLSQDAQAALAATQIYVELNDDYAGTSAGFVLGEVRTSGVPVSDTPTQTVTLDFEDGAMPALIVPSSDWSVGSSGYNSNDALLCNSTTNGSEATLDASGASMIHYWYWLTTSSTYSYFNLPGVVGADNESGCWRHADIVLPPGIDHSGLSFKFVKDATHGPDDTGQLGVDDITLDYP